jgi:hypothetical protein
MSVKNDTEAKLSDVLDPEFRKAFEARVAVLSKRKRTRPMIEEAWALVNILFVLSDYVAEKAGLSVADDAAFELVEQEWPGWNLLFNTLTERFLDDIEFYLPTPLCS